MGGGFGAVHVHIIMLGILNGPTSISLASGGYKKHGKYRQVTSGHGVFVSHDYKLAVIL